MGKLLNAVFASKSVKIDKYNNCSIVIGNGSLLNITLERNGFIRPIGHKFESPLQGAGKTTYLLSAHFRYGNGYLASYPDLT
jgi:hypothetical protein